MIHRKQSKNQRPRLHEPAKTLHAVHPKGRHRAQPHRGVADVPVPVAARLADRLAHRSYGPLCDRRRRHRVLRGNGGRGPRPQDPSLRRHLSRRPDRRISPHHRFREGIRRRSGDAARPFRRARLRARPAVQSRRAQRRQQGRGRRAVAVDLVERGVADRGQDAAARDDAKRHRRRGAGVRRRRGAHASRGLRDSRNPRCARLPDPAVPLAGHQPPQRLLRRRSEGADAVRDRGDESGPRSVAAGQAVVLSRLQRRRQGRTCGRCTTPSNSRRN
jgi:hypothetical protein